MKRLLFVSYYFPPSGGPGVQRTLKFTKYLPDNGWAPTVLTVDPQYASYPDLDETLAADVADDLAVIRTRSWDPYASYARILGRSKDDTVGVAFVREESAGLRQRVGLWIRANVFTPDARYGWVPFARKAADTLYREQPFDAVLTTGPPHSTHLVGRGLARKWGVPWVADMRDPWTGIYYYPQLPMTSLAARRDRRLEKSVLTEADAVTVVSSSMVTNLNKRVDREYVYLPNGFDPADFQKDSVPSDDRFVIRHIGTLSRTQNPKAVWSGLQSLVSSTPGDVVVELIGHVDAEIMVSLRERGLGDTVRVFPYVDHDRAVALMQAASLLLLVIPDGDSAHEIVTGKLFEYLASGRPTLAIGPPDGDAGTILSECQGGRMLDHHDPKGVHSFLAEQVAAFKRGERVVGADTSDIQQYARPAQASALANVLDRVSTPRND
ncbi:MAG: glycosyltransferase family 4 protein [Rhodothermales bacterium]|nr:glycosyltransferase family 4 protein [Rhodothermales bacterium]